ncbi:MAG: hypothetical protein FWB85_05400 [Chitinispirillia bacterium]|nr:hypothetical protein [Chitinispirillia bacterium]MCL2241661.1 hypothetical protein [Chitinispirillia bacterium]
MEDFIKNNIEEFKRDGKSFIYFNISGLTDNDQFEKFAGAAKKLISKYEPKSVYVLTSHLTFFDTKTKEISAGWIIHNKPYVIASALVDINGLTRMVAKSIYKQAGREFATPFTTKEEAIQWLLTQDSVNWGETS